MEEAGHGGRAEGTGGGGQGEMMRMATWAESGGEGGEREGGYHTHCLLASLSVLVALLTGSLPLTMRSWVWRWRRYDLG